MALEETNLYRLISKGTKESLLEALKVVSGMSQDECRKRSEEDNSTYLHHIVNQVPAVYSRYQQVSPLVPLLYRLALRGISVNAQNTHGNTCLLLACLRPHGELICPHLIRIGADPCMLNKKQCRVIHTVRHNKCVVVKGQKTAKSGLWNAVEKEDFQIVEGLMKTWCRVNIHKNKKSLQSVADETGNINIIRLLQKYRARNELVTAAFACEPDRIKDLMKGMSFTDNILDESHDVPKPLIVALEELGDVTKEAVKVLRNNGLTNGMEYNKQVETRMTEFEMTPFYSRIEMETAESFQEVLQMLSDNKVDVALHSFRDNHAGWNLLHYIVDKYNQIRDLEMRRLLVRMIYRLALAGVDVNERDHQGRTPLHIASACADQTIMTHIIRIGGDPSIATLDGQAIHMETYEDRGKMVFNRHYRQTDQPGLWVAIEMNDIGKAERWLKSWARVNVKRGDRKMLEIARAMKRTEIVRLLEQYDHINEFVCATFACDLKLMMHLLALGKGKNKVNTIDDFFHVGFTWDRHAEYMPRPIIVSAMEICDPPVVDFLLRFGADLSKQHEESEPCGPVAFWAFRDHVDNDNALVVAKYADVNLRDELGATMLHKAVQKNWSKGKSEIIQMLLERGVDVAARDLDGSTARDLLHIHEIEDAAALRQIIDDHVLELVANDQHYQIETLMIDDYDHILDIKGTKRNKTAKEIAHLKEYKDLLILLDEMKDYRAECDMLHESARKGDLMTISKLSGEKRCATSRDKAGRSLLHNACLFGHEELVSFLVEQYPNLINSRDNLNRTPLHYCVCLEDRQAIWQIMLDSNGDSNYKDVNNLSVYDYVRELEKPTPTNQKPRGRRWQDYRPQNVISVERTKQYGAKSDTWRLYRELLPSITNETIQEVRKITSSSTASLSVDDLDIKLLKLCVDNKRQEIAKHLIQECGARPHVNIPTGDDSSDAVSLMDYARKSGCPDLAQFISDIPPPEDSTQEAKS